MPKKKDAPKKAGRPLADIDQRQFEQLCALQCTEKEIAAFFNVDPTTLVSWCKRTYDGDDFQTARNKKAEVGKISLRRTQFKQAEKSSAMAIWLGKQYLGQKDQINVASELVRDEKDPLSLAFEQFMNPKKEADNDESVK